MGRAARRATWIVAALLAVAGTAWVATSLDERRDVADGTDGTAHDADAREIGRAHV